MIYRYSLVFVSLLSSIALLLNQQVLAAAPIREPAQIAATASSNEAADKVYAEAENFTNKEQRKL